MDIKILIKNLTWFNLVEKLKVILNKLVASAFVDAPIDGNQYARQDGEWEQITIPSAGVESVTGDYVDNTDPLNPILGDPRPYKVYTALLTQTGTNAPVATVLENTLGGEVVWSYEGAGDYSATLLGRFTVDRTYATVNCPDNGYVAQIIRVNEDEVSLTINPSEDTVSNTYPFTIEIRVYN